MQANRIWQLLSRKMDGEASMDELRELEQLLMNLPEDAYKIDIVTSHFQKKPNSGTFDEEENLAWEKHIEVMRNLYPEEFDDASSDVFPPRRHSLISHFRRPKAVLFSMLLVVIFSISWLLYQKQAGPSLSPGASHVQLSDQNNLTHPSKIKRILPDGTQVWLNGDSHISYQENFGKNNRREVVLIGEAFFDVTHNEHVPFIVHAKSINITVRGTAFNVKAYPEDKNVETSLLRGMVEVSTKADPKIKFVLKPSEKINISVSAENEIRPSKPGRKKLVERDYGNSYNIDKLQADARSNIIPEVAWLQDKLMFESEPLSEIVKKMQRWYGATIEIKDDRLKDLRFTGAFSNETLRQALSALQATYPFEISMDNDVVILYIK
jgi:ferric-dicitrate binding protein FerR (iron transport regulator)